MPGQKSPLRYIPATHVEADNMPLEGMQILDDQRAERLGRFDGLVVDPDARQACYMVVDSGGWWRTKRLLPLRDARLEGGSLHVDVPRSALSRYPSFNPDSFAEMSDDDLRTFERETESDCCPHESVADDVESYDALMDRGRPEWGVGWPISPEDADAIRGTLPSGPRTD